MRFIGLDVHRDFCEVAIAEDGELRSAGRVETAPEALELFAAKPRARRRGGPRGDRRRGFDRPHHRPARRARRRGQGPGPAASRRQRPRPTASTPARSPACWPRAI